MWVCVFEYYVLWYQIVKCQPLGSAQLGNSGILLWFEEFPISLLFLLVLVGVQVESLSNA